MHSYTTTCSVQQLHTGSMQQQHNKPPLPGGLPKAVHVPVCVFSGCSLLGLGKLSMTCHTPCGKDSCTTT